MLMTGKYQEVFKEKRIFSSLKEQDKDNSIH